jgi:hypothetical protein
MQYRKVLRPMLNCYSSYSNTFILLLKSVFSGCLMVLNMSNSSRSPLLCRLDELPLRLRSRSDELFWLLLAALSCFWNRFWRRADDDVCDDRDISSSLSSLFSQFVFFSVLLGFRNSPWMFLFCVADIDNSLN